MAGENHGLSEVSGRKQPCADYHSFSGLDGLWTVPPSEQQQ
jgi:hypothetical protein